MILHTLRLCNFRTKFRTILFVRLCALVVRHRPQNHRIVHGFSGQGIRPTLERATGVVRHRIQAEADRAGVCEQVECGVEGGRSCGEPWSADHGVIPTARTRSGSRIQDTGSDQATVPETHSFSTVRRLGRGLGGNFIRGQAS